MQGYVATLVLPLWGPEMARGDIAILVFPHHGDPKKSRVMRPCLILSPSLGDPREGRNYVAMLVLPHYGVT